MLESEEIFAEEDEYHLSVHRLCLYQHQRSNHTNDKLRTMAYMNKFTQSDDYRREELIRIIEHSVEKLTLAELEALYYDMSTKSYIND